MENVKSDVIPNWVKRIFICVFFPIFIFHIIYISYMKIKNPSKKVNSGSQVNYADQIRALNLKNEKERQLRIKREKLKPKENKHELDLNCRSLKCEHLKTKEMIEKVELVSKKEWNDIQKVSSEYKNILLDIFKTNLEKDTLKNKLKILMLTNTESQTYEMFGNKRYLFAIEDLIEEIKCDIKCSLKHYQDYDPKYYHCDNYQKYIKDVFILESAPLMSAILTREKEHWNIKNIINKIELGLHTEGLKFETLNLNFNPNVCQSMSALSRYCELKKEEELISNLICKFFAELETHPDKKKIEMLNEKYLSNMTEFIATINHAFSEEPLEITKRIDVVVLRDYIDSIK